MGVWLGSLVALALAGGWIVPGRVVVTAASVEIYKPIVFRFGSDRMPAGADRMLAAMAQTIDGNPALQRIAVEAIVAPGEPESIGLRRATAVRTRLIALGVAPSRLIAEAAFGAKPVIELVVIRRAP